MEKEEAGGPALLGAACLPFFLLSRRPLLFLLWPGSPHYVVPPEGPISGLLGPGRGLCAGAASVMRVWHVARREKERKKTRERKTGI